MNKSVSIVGTNGLPANYGGWETLVENTVEYLVRDFDVTVYCSGVKYKNRLDYYKGARLRYVNLKANGVMSILYDLITIVMSTRHSHVVLILGVSGGVFLPIIRLISSAKLVVNIDGLEWKRSKWKWWIQRYLEFSEFLAVKSCHAIVSDNKVIESYIYRRYKLPSALISYGGDHCSSQEFEFGGDLKPKSYAFKVCRIEPENNVEMILDAFCQKQREYQLVIVGNWKNSEYGKQLRKTYSNIVGLYLLDPIYNQVKLDQLRSNCLVYIHGHSAGGTNPSLVEAMYLGLPIVSYGVDFNRETTFGEGVYFDNAEGLDKILSELYLCDLDGIGKRMQELAIANYKWEIVAKRYSKLFRELN